MVSVGGAGEGAEGSRDKGERRGEGPDTPMGPPLFLLIYGFQLSLNFNVCITSQNGATVWGPGLHMSQ